MYSQESIPSPRTDFYMFVMSPPWFGCWNIYSEFTMSFYSTPEGQKEKFSFHAPQNPATIIPITSSWHPAEPAGAEQGGGWMARISSLLPRKEGTGSQARGSSSGPGLAQGWHRARSRCQMAPREQPRLLSAALAGPARELPQQLWPLRPAGIFVRCCDVIRNPLAYSQ